MRKRKRARKACIPCHQRKRKCDAKYPCGMCTTYEYNCKYAEDEATNGIGNGAQHTSPNTQSGDEISSWASTASRNVSRRSYAEQSPRNGDGSSAKIPNATTGIFDVGKSRYAGASSAMSFPYVLGLALGSNSLPKMPSFAYNFGTRPEEASTVHNLLGQIISEDDLSFFSDVFFSALAPIADYLDQRIYRLRCRAYYHGTGSADIAFGAVAAGVAALGSYLSVDRHAREADLVQYAKTILDDPASMRMLCIDHVIAWALRTFYLRGTTRPNTAWIASCTAVHLCEAMGLHEEENIVKIASVAGAAAVGHDADRLRRIFWISWAGHNMLSYEYDRSAVQFRSITCQAILPTQGSFADQFVKIVQVIPTPNAAFQLDSQPSSLREELFERLKVLQKLPFTHPFLVLTKADVAFCFYRRIYQLKMGISDEMIQLVVDSGNDATEAAEQLAKQGRLFWNIIGSVFQYACILLAMDTPVASASISTAFKCLENLANIANTELTHKTLSMARHLLSLTMAKKRQELTQLEAVEAEYQPLQGLESETNASVPDLSIGVDWEQLFAEPYLSMLGSDVQLW